jgi:hypothetical protein
MEKLLHDVTLGGGAWLTQADGAVFCHRGYAFLQAVSCTRALLRGLCSFDRIIAQPLAIEELDISGANRPCANWISALSLFGIY